MTNPWKKIVFPITGSATTMITGSIYKVCMGDPQTTSFIHSASFGWQNQGTNQLDPGTPIPDLAFDLHYHDNAGDTCIEADFTYVSASIGTNVYYKKFGGQRWYSVGPGVPHNFDVNQ